nr:MFS transporter [uncultured Schaedlerella sp.]
MDTKVKLKFKDQFAYFCGDAGGSMINLLIDMYILTFCTYVLGIDAAWMAGLFLFARIWDAINDPLIGSLPDRFRIGKSGDKFKPYVKISMIPLAISVLMIFADISGWNDFAKHVWVAVAYILYGTSYTGTSMPYGAMASVITDDPIERTKLSRARSIGGTAVGLIFLPIVSLMIWNSDQTANAQGFFKVAVIAAVVSLIFYSCLILFSKERIHESTEKKADIPKYSFFHVLKLSLTNRPLIGVMIASMGGIIANAANGSLASYLYKPELFTG